MNPLADLALFGIGVSIATVVAWRLRASRTGLYLGLPGITALLGAAMFAAAVWGLFYLDWNPIEGVVFPLLGYAAAWKALPWSAGSAPWP